MRNIFLLININILLLSGCNKTMNSSIEKEIFSLKTNKDQQFFLEKIHDLDQTTRINKQALEVKYGYNSNQVKAAEKDMIKIDRINLIKIEKYLELYNHPKIKDHGRKACQAPWLVIHHSSTVEAREKGFKYLYEAYKRGDLRSSSFSMFLNRWYTIKYGKRLSLPNPYKEEDMINTLIDRIEP